MEPVEPENMPVYPPTTVTFGVPTTTVEGMTLFDSARGGWGQHYLIKAEGITPLGERFHSCDTPDADLFDGLHWSCPECRREWEIHTERWWADVEE